MKELGLFGITIPEEYGGIGLDLTTYTMIVEELSRGWISISGVVNTHFIGSYLLMKFGTDEQKERLLPRWRRASPRGLLLSSPSSAPTCRRSRPPPRRGRRLRVNGQKMWVTNGLMSGVVFVLVRPIRGRPALQGHDASSARRSRARARHRRLRGPAVPPKIKKMGYKGVESTELVFDGYSCRPT